MQGISEGGGAPGSQTSPPQPPSQAPARAAFSHLTFRDAADNVRVLSNLARGKGFAPEDKPALNRMLGTGHVYVRFEGGHQQWIVTDLGLEVLHALKPEL